MPQVWSQKHLKMIQETNTIVNEYKSCNFCRMMYVVLIYLWKHSTKPVLASIPKQSVDTELYVLGQYTVCSGFS